MLDKNEELLRSVTLGELDWSSKEVLAARAEDPEFDQAMRETELILSGLDHLNSPEKEILELASMADPDAQDDFVKDFVRARVSPPSRLSRWSTAAAAAIVITTTWWFFQGPQELDGPGDGILGARVLEATQPVGEVGASDTIDPVFLFEWEASMTDGTYRVVIYNGEDGGEWLKSPSLTEKSWTLSATESADLPEEFEWEVQWFNEEGERKLTADPVLVSR